MSVGPEDQIRALTEQLQQLQAVNTRLQQEAAVQPNAVAGQGGVSSSQQESLVNPRYVIIPRERKCPRFSGNNSIGCLGVEEWVEEARRCLNSKHMTSTEQALFLYDHLDGEAKSEIRFRPTVDRNNPDRILAILLETFGCPQSYIEAQKQFFQRRQRDGESLREFSHAVMSLMEVIERKNPGGIPDSDVVIRDHFAEYVRDNMLRRELKRLIRSQPSMSFINVRSEALRWSDDGERPSLPRIRAYSCDTHIDACELGVNSSAVTVEPSKEISELKETLRKQQVQLDAILQRLSNPVWQAAPSGPSTQPRRYRFDSEGQPICIRCGQPGHIARRCRNWEGAHQAAAAGEVQSGAGGCGRNTYAMGPSGN